MLSDVVYQSTRKVLIAIIHQKCTFPKIICKHSCICYSKRITKMLFITTIWTEKGLKQMFFFSVEGFNFMGLQKSGISYLIFGANLKSVALLSWRGSPCKPSEGLLCQGKIYEVLKDLVKTSSHCYFKVIYHIHHL